MSILEVHVSAILYVVIFSGPGRFTITSISTGTCNDIIKVTYMEVSRVTIYSYKLCVDIVMSCISVSLLSFLFQNEPDCPGYPTERFTVDINGVQVADLTADAVQSLAINHANGSMTLSLPLNQALPKNAVTLNMTKYNTVPTNRSDNTGNIVTEMVTWGTSAVFSELELTTIEICILYSCTFFNDGAYMYVLHS